LLGTAADVEVVGEASTGDEAVAMAERLQPDVVLMDVNMPGSDGIEATGRIVEGAPHVAIVVLTMDAGDASIVSALRAGARGYVLKGAQRTELLRAIRAASAGEAILGPGVARRLAGYLAPAAPVSPRPFPDLTEREREILELVARGQSNAEITSGLVLSPKTVRNHVSNIFGKLGARDRAEAIVMAREAGLGARGVGQADPPVDGRRGRGIRDTDRDAGPMTAGRAAIHDRGNRSMA
jgi:DNA-binding NarL/FixJ family response regulator